MILKAYDEHWRGAPAVKNLIVLPLYQEAQAIVLRDVPVVPLAHTQLRAAHTKRPSGFEVHPTGLVRLRTAKLGGTP